MNEAQEKLQVLKDAWEGFKKTAHEATEEEHRAFKDIIQEMDQAEIQLKRKNVERLYE